MSRSTQSDNQQGTPHSTASDLGELRTPGFAERLAYGCGDVASNLVFIAVASFLTFFYTDVVGIDAGVVGTIFLVSRLIAAVSDLAIGIAMEKRRSRRGGKALPWLKWFAVPFGLSVALMFSAPDLGDTGKIVYAFITFNLCASVIYSAINIPYGVLATLMTKDQFGRALLNTFRMVGCYVGSIAIAAVTLPMVDGFGGGALAWTYTFLIIGALVTALFLITFRFCREAVSPAEVSTDDRKAPPLPVMRTLGLLAGNRYWMLLLGFSVVLNILLTLPGVSLYYAKWVLGDESAATGILTLRMIAELSGVLLAVPVVKRWGKRNACILACAVIVAGQLLILIDPSTLTTVIIGQCVAGIGAGAILGSIFAMIGDVIEHVEWRSHVRAEGIVYSGISVGQKIGAGIGSMIIGMMLAGSGYVSSATASEQPESAIGAIGFLFIWLPVISAVAMAALLIGYTLDRRYPRIVSELAARREAVGS
ncbi:MFS transporter [Microbacterium sp. EST19A]|uniref:MFS transporter n=1 Tax=Microbacterium sp. EST19A TaxID=2862681 RepID=UPI001CBB877D|nr:glycoside-pentoside-hexuronide (GPH):cation symporter [Microbacterium sp. EST19A]